MNAAWYKPGQLTRSVLSQRAFLTSSRFLGAHLDIGGSAAKDGLSLYPLQWMLLESKAKGLELHFDGTFGGRAPIDDPTTVVFPQDDTDGKGKDMWSCAADNGVGVDIQDLRKVHELPKYGKRYSIHLNHDNAIFWIRNSREVFALSGELRGYCSFGTSCGIRLCLNGYSANYTDSFSRYHLTSFDLHDP